MPGGRRAALDQHVERQQLSSAGGLDRSDEFEVLEHDIAGVSTCGQQRRLADDERAGPVTGEQTVQ